VKLTFVVTHALGVSWNVAVFQPLSVTIAVDVMFFDGMARLMAHSARVPIRRHEAVGQIAGNSRTFLHLESTISQRTGVPPWSGHRSLLSGRNV